MYTLDGNKMEKYIVTLVNIKTNSEFKTTIFADEGETTENIVLKIYVEDEEICVSDYNYLPAYQKLRDRLLERTYGIKCNGSQLNVVQSGMMGANDLVYLVELGRKALNKDIVSLYEYADLKEFPDTQEQNSFIEKWRISIL